MQLFILSIVTIIIVVISYYLICYHHIEHYYRHLYGQFGGIPNDSQLWSNQVRTIF
jgi:hypothetical protein